MVAAEKIFGTHKDPDQIPITTASARKLSKFSPHAFTYLVDEKNNPVSWVVVVPTSRPLMGAFLHKKITERELLQRTRPRATYEALYLCAAITLPSYRRRGYAQKLLRHAVGHIPKQKNVEYFAWPISKPGKALSRKLERTMKVSLRTPKTKS